MSDRMKADLARYRASMIPVTEQIFNVGELQRQGFPVKGDPACSLVVHKARAANGTETAWLEMRSEKDEPIATANISHPPCGDFPLPPCPDD